ncbi:hypothetical protein J4771_02130 [Candidatus Kaistella beijingensis]|uniref:hypothetical protein n=1 Tax=Candidatus Kaistella beijingensis TaxID=2820270 RepID=UPI001CC49FD2|nr:hypothetical protein [Candidatus Kaistella beijingensis]UBB90173.1 hypothetical protein J4771_02130 [Candidatus Kaistella beijingensis]
MKNLILILLVFFYYPFLSQNLTFSEINSKNILNLLNAESIKSYEQGSKTAVIQIGDNNKANVYDRSKKSDLMIRQTGDFNTTLMTNTNPEIENKQKVSVEGNNNYIDITGNNSNSKEMQINLKTNDKMIFVRHF